MGTFQPMEGQENLSGSLGFGDNLWTGPNVMMGGDYEIREVTL